jgi:hypothetical protein
MMDLAAIRALIEGHAINLSATLDNGLNGFLMAGGHVLSIKFDIFGAVSAKDFGNGLHVTAPSSDH